MSPKMFMIAAIAGGLASIVAVVGEFAKLTYFRKIALRIPDDALADRAKSLRWVMAISLSIVLVSGTIAGISHGVCGAHCRPGADHDDGGGAWRQFAGSLSAHGAR